MTHETQLVDFEVQNHGSIALLNALTPDAEQWVTDHLQVESWQYWGPNGVAIDHRMIGDIVFGIQNDGLTVQGAGF